MITSYLREGILRYALLSSLSITVFPDRQCIHHIISSGAVKMPLWDMSDIMYVVEKEGFLCSGTYSSHSV
jgi:hypothetical protein